MSAFSADDTAANVARVLLIVTVVLTYPMSHFALRLYIASLLKEADVIRSVELTLPVHVLLTLLCVKQLLRLLTFCFSCNGNCTPH